MVVLLLVVVVVVVAEVGQPGGGAEQLAQTGLLPVLGTGGVLLAGRRLALALLVTVRARLVGVLVVVGARLLVLVVRAAYLVVARDGAHLEVQPLGYRAARHHRVDQEQPVHQVRTQQGERADDMSARAHGQRHERAHAHLGANVHYALGHLLNRRISEVVRQCSRRLAGPHELLANEVDVDDGERLQHQFDLVALAKCGKLELTIQA